MLMLCTHGYQRHNPFVMDKKRFCSCVVPMLLVLALLAGCSKTQLGSSDLPYQETYDQAYGTGTFRKYDLFLPAGRNQQTKVVLLLHGGGWVTGDKWGCKYYAQKFAAAGYAAVSMNYRLANDSVHYTEMLEDIDSVIGCVVKNSGQWGIGNGPVALFGYSAGGHLALLYAYARDPGKQTGAVISVAGPTDVRDSLLWQSPGLYDDIVTMAGDTLPANWAQASPVSFLSPSNPPTLLIHGTLDNVVPVSQSVTLDQMLRASNSTVDLLLLENEGHGYSAEATELFLSRSETFLHENLK